MKNLSFQKDIPFSYSVSPKIKKRLLDSWERLKREKTKQSKGVGWLDWPERITSKEVAEITKTAREIKNKAEAFVLLGVGGSYLGARAGIEALASAKEKEKIFYAGCNLSPSFLNGLLEKLRNKKYVYVNVVSKSGSTLETRLAWDILKKELKKRWGKNFSRFVVATTTEGEGVLYKEAIKNNYKIFSIPQNIGGRYSVLTAVGLLPMAGAGIDIKELLKGSREAQKNFWDKPLVEDKNKAFQYALWRRQLYAEGGAIEALAFYAPRLFYLGKWWQQLFAESEGKRGRGIFPTILNFTQDLHSLGQYIQEGRRILWETVISVAEEEKLIVSEGETKRELGQINKIVAQAVEKAHLSAGVPQLKITLPRLTPFYLGQLFYFFELSCALSAYASGVNPFDQPGVEEYKKEIKKLL